LLRLKRIFGENLTLPPRRRPEAVLLQIDSRRLLKLKNQPEW
jgi:hypothetical protein